MYNFNQHLYIDETILYQGKANPGKGSKNIGTTLFVIAFILIIQVLLIYAFIIKTGDIVYDIINKTQAIIIFLVTLLCNITLIYIFIYNLFFKKKAVSDDFYCLTNQRVFKFESKKNKLVFGYLIKYEDMKIYNVKNDYGDLYMGIIATQNSNTDAFQNLASMKELITNPNEEDMPCITFESIEKPGQILKLAEEARRELVKKQTNT